VLVIVSVILGVLKAVPATRKHVSIFRAISIPIELVSLQLICVSISQLRENTEGWSFSFALITLILLIIWSLVQLGVGIASIFKEKKDQPRVFPDLKDNAFGKLFPFTEFLKKFVIAILALKVDVAHRVFDSKFIVLFVVLAISCTFPFKSRTENISLIVVNVLVTLSVLFFDLSIDGHDAKVEVWTWFFIIFSTITSFAISGVIFATTVLNSIKTVRKWSEQPDKSGVYEKSV